MPRFTLGRWLWFNSGGICRCTKVIELSVLDIVEIGHPVLRQVAEEVPVGEIGTAEVQQLIDDLIDTKRHAKGCLLYTSPSPRD